MPQKKQWFETLQLQLRQEHGKGWSVREIGAAQRNPIGRCQLTPPLPGQLTLIHPDQFSTGGLMEQCNASLPRSCQERANRENYLPR